MSVIGWDIGGVNTKAARAVGGRLTGVHHEPYELLRAPALLVARLKALAVRLGGQPADAHAVTMTAELSQLFRTKREGVHFVLDAVDAAFPHSDVRVFGVDGRFLSVAEARERPLVVAAANWAAAAMLVAEAYPDALLVDVGTTTTDLIPIVGGRVVPEGRTDPERLASGELVYTGALRTPAEAIASHVPVAGVMTGVSAEGFALAGDVHLWRGDLAESDYTVATPDGRPASREYAGERLARLVCGDRDLIDDRGVSEVADALSRAQVERIASAVARVAARHPSIGTAVVTGLGAFIADAAASVAGLQVERLSARLGREAARCAPAAAVALLLDCKVLEPILSAPPPSPPAIVDLVVKLGGGVLVDARAFDAVLAELASALPYERAVIVPGGGPFADAVRDLDQRLGLTNDEAHWMAIQAMDQYAALLAARLPGATLVSGPADVVVALGRGRVPVLAPYEWLRRTDPVPHSWHVTSDSLAAWIAGALGAARLVVVKPSGARGGGLVDAQFAHTLPPAVRAEIVAADEVERLRALLRAGAGSGVVGERAPG